MESFIGGDLMEKFIQTYIYKYPESSVNVTQLNGTWVDFINDNIADEA